MFEEGFGVLGLVVDDDEFGGHRCNGWLSGCAALISAKNAAKISAAPAIATRRLSAMKSKIEPVVFADGVAQVAEQVLKDTGFLAIYGPFQGE